MSITIALLNSAKNESDLTGKYLTSKGYRVLPRKSNDSELASFFRSETVDLVLLDLADRRESSVLNMAQEVSQEYSVPLICLSPKADDQLLQNVLSKTNDLVLKGGSQFLKQLLVRIKYNIARRPTKRLKCKKGILALPHVTAKKMAAQQLADSSIDDIRTMPRISLDYADITHIGMDSHDKHFIEIHTADERIFNHTYSLKKIENILPLNFMRIERGRIVNLNHLTARINGKWVEVNGQPFAVGTNYLIEVRRRISELYD